jgi:3-keto-disaccharide hydrolase
MPRTPAPPDQTMREEITMKRRSVVVMSLLLMGFAVFWHAHEAPGQGSEGWITLFDGTNLDHWTRLGEANWTLADGVVQADKRVGEGSAFLVSKNAYTDFQLKVEFWVDTVANSGIFIRCTDAQKITATNAYEVNIFDTRPDPSYGTGAIVNVAKVDPMPKAGDKWNTFEITAKGPQLTVVLNGTKTVDIQDSQFASGPLALQYGSGVVKFRKVEIKPL